MNYNEYLDMVENINRDVRFHSNLIKTLEHPLFIILNNENNNSNIYKHLINDPSWVDILLLKCKYVNINYPKDIFGLFELQVEFWLKWLKNEIRLNKLNKILKDNI